MFRVLTQNVLVRMIGSELFKINFGIELRMDKQRGWCLDILDWPSALRFECYVIWACFYLFQFEDEWTHFPPSCGREPRPHHRPIQFSFLHLNIPIHPLHEPKPRVGLTNEPCTLADISTPCFQPYTPLPSLCFLFFYLLFLFFFVFE